MTFCKESWMEITKIAFLVVVFLTNGFVTYILCQCQGDLIIVPKCPQSLHDWHLRAEETCTYENKYHCLITENPNQLIECCMSYHNISKGHLPRYNTLQKSIQEIACYGNYFMPTQFESNRYRENGVENCKYKKTLCVDMEGMEVYDDGNTTEDRQCYCNYRQYYVPEEPTENFFFTINDNDRCIKTQKCNQTTQELNMMYQCVNKCPSGYYRPEMSMDCIPLETSTTTKTFESSKPEVQPPDSLTTSTPLPTTTDNMVKPSVENKGSNNEAVIALAVMCSIAFASTAIILLCIYCRREHNIIDGEPHLFSCFRYTNVNTDEFIAGNKHNTLINKHKDAENKFEVLAVKDSYLRTIGSKVELKVNVPRGLNRIIWLFNGKPVDTSLGSKYSQGDLQNPSLIIHNIESEDCGNYVCKVFDEEDIDAVCGPITLELQEPVLKLTNSLVNVKYGDKTMIECDIKNGPPNYQIYWEKICGETVIRLDINKETSGKYEGSDKEYPHLIIRNTEMSDEAFYCCCLEYRSSSGELLHYKSNRSHLHVKNGPDPSTVMSTEPVPIVEMKKHSVYVATGEKIILECVISHKQKDFTVFWEKIKIKNGMEEVFLLEINEGTKEKYDGSTIEYPHLVIKNAAESDEALYRCCLSTSNGKSLYKSDRTYLLVQKEKSPQMTHIEKQINIDAGDINAGHINIGTGVVTINRKAEDSEVKLDDSSLESDYSGPSSLIENGINGADGTDNHISDRLSETGSIQSSSLKPNNIINAESTKSQIGTLDGEKLSDKNVIDIKKGNNEKIIQLLPTEDEMINMKRIAELHHCIVANVRGDGNCMFYAIALQIWDLLKNKIAEQKAKELRETIVDFLSNNDTTPHGEKYSAFLPEEGDGPNEDKWEKYLQSMRKPGTYGDEIILRAISHYYKVSVCVLSTRSPNYIIQYHPDNSDTSCRKVYLGYLHGDRHYVRLIPSGDCRSVAALTESTI